MSGIYLDHASTTPCDPAVVEAMCPFFHKSFGNASSPHQFGRRARKAVEEARETLARLIGIQSAEIVFTAGASESNNQAIFAAAWALKNKGRHIVASAIEHHSVLGPLHRLEEDGLTVSFIKPGSDGVVAAQDMINAMTEQTILVCLQHANNEIGTIQPVEAVGKLCRERGILFLVDATQTVGHIPVKANDLCCDLLSLSAHKFYGPQGVGALYVRKGLELPALILGGDQERGRRAGTPNMPGIVGLGVAVKLAQAQMSESAARETKLRDQLIEAVLSDVPGAVLNGCPRRRLPNNAHFSFENIDGEELVSALDMEGIAVSMGSACTWGRLEPSHVLKAMGRSDSQALGSLRVSVGRGITSELIEEAITVIKDKVRQLRG